MPECGEVGGAFVAGGDHVSGVRLDDWPGFDMFGEFGAGGVEGGELGGSVARHRRW